MPPHGLAGGSRGLATHAAGLSPAQTTCAVAVSSQALHAGDSGSFLRDLAARDLVDSLGKMNSSLFPDGIS